MTLRDLHRTSALAILVYAAMHIVNHLTATLGVTAHIAFMEAARTIYRQPVVEGLLLSLVAFQIGSGLWLFVRGWRERSGLVPWLQAISGAYLSFFLLIHVSAVIFGRAVLHLDTNFYYAAAGLYVPPNQYFFAPYYFLSVLALFTHLGCALYWQLESKPELTRKAVVGLSAALGAVISLIIVLSLAGLVQPVEIPEKYKATYTQQAN